MGFIAWLKTLFTRRQVEKDIASQSYGSANGKNNLPLEPEKDPWRS